MELFQEFLASPAGIAAKAMLVLAGLDFLLGVWAAVRDGTFDATKSGAVLVKHVLGRVFPIATLLSAGFFTQDTFLLTGGIGAAVIYSNETRASLLESIGQVMNPAKTEKEALKENPVPTE